MTLIKWLLSIKMVFTLKELHISIFLNNKIDDII